MTHHQWNEAKPIRSTVEFHSIQGCDIRHKTNSALDRCEDKMDLVDPDMMHPKALRDYVQEMVCSIYRLPAAVVQFGVGLEAATQRCR